MELLKTLLEAAELSNAQKAKLKEIAQQKAEVYAANQRRLAVIEAIAKSLNAEQAGLETDLTELMRSLNQANVILDGVAIDFKEGGFNAGRTSYQKVAEELTTELQKYDKDSARIYERLVEKFRGEGTAKKPVLKVVTDGMNKFFDLVANTSAEDLLRRVGTLEKYPELIAKEKARNSKKAVNEGIGGDAKKLLAALGRSIGRAARALLPRAKTQVERAKRIEALAKKLK